MTLASVSRAMGEENADKNFGPVSIIPNMNLWRIHHKVWKIWALKNFDADFFDVDGITNGRTNIRTD